MGIYVLRVIKDGRTVGRKQLTEGAAKADAAVLKAQAGQVYVLGEVLGGAGPAKIRAKRVGADLHVAIVPGQVDLPDFIIEGYFNYPPGSILGGLKEGGQAAYDLGAVTANTSNGALSGSAAAETSFTPVESSLGDPATSWFGWSSLQFFGGLGLAAAGAYYYNRSNSSDSGSSDASAAALSKISAYAGDHTLANPSVADYTAAGVTGVSATNLSAINSAVAAHTAAQVADKATLQGMVDAYVKILAEANGSTADDTPGNNPTVAQYQAIGVTLGAAATSAQNLALLNEVVGNKTTSDVDSIAELNAIVVAVNDLIAASASASGTEVTLNDLVLLGLTGVNASNLAAVQAAIAATADNGTGVDTLTELQTVVNGAVSLSLIQAYADNNINTKPSVTNYSNLGVTGVSSSNIDAINSAVDALTGSGLSTRAAVQLMVDAYAKILAEANGSSGDATPNVNPTVADYQAIGVTLGAAASAAQNLALLNELVASKSSTDVDTIAELNALADATNAVIAASASANGSSLSLATLQLLGLSGVTAGNLAFVQAAIAATADNGSEVDSLSELQALVSLGLIQAYANSSSNGKPSLSDYTNVGITGVSSGNLDAINSAVDALNASNLGSKTALQTMVDTYNKILAEANGSSGDATPNVNPTVADYQTIGADIGLAATNDKALSLLNDVLGSLNSTSVDSIAEINALAAVITKVINLASGNAASLSLADFALVGLPTSGVGAVSSSNLAAINGAIANAGGAGNVDSVSELSTLVQAEATLINYAGDSSQTAPTVSQYTVLGITGVNSINLTSVNSALAVLSADKVDTKAEMQAVVNAYNLILAEANGSLADTTPGVNPTAAQYALIGANIGLAATDAENLSLLNDSLGTLVSTAIDTIAEINALADAANAVMTDAAGGASVSLAQLSLLGITGATSDNLTAIQAAIAATADNGLQVDTMAELQTLVTDTAHLATTSQGIISAYANSNAAAAPSVNDYKQIGVTGVSADNLSAMNSAVDALTSSNVDSPYKVQLVVNAYNNILAEANGATADATPGVDPTANDFSAIGAHVGLAAVGQAGGGDLAASALGLLDNTIGGMSTSSVDSIAELNALGAAVDKVMNLAALATGATIPVGALTMADLSVLGIDTSLADQASEVDAILQGIRDSSDNGSSLATILALQTLVNNHVL